MKCFTKPSLIAVSVCFVLAVRLNAATRTWDGGGLNGSFSDPVNWDGNATFPTTINDTLQAGANAGGGGSSFIGFDTGSEFRTPSFTFLSTASTAYIVTANSSSDFLTLTASGMALQNLSPIRQNFSLIVTTVGAATQTWDGGAQGLVLAQIDLGSSHVLSIDGTGTSATTRNEISGGISGNASGLTKTGAGTLVLRNAGLPSDYTGSTTLLNGRLQLGLANQIPNTSKLVLSGGTFDTGGFSETAGVLSLGGSAAIDFGTSNTVSLVFGDSHSELWSAGTLNILNFTAGADSLRVGTNASALTAGQLAQISFNGQPASISSTGFLLPVPEPSVSATILSGLGVLGFYRRRRDRTATT